VIAGLHDPTRGIVRVDGVAIHALADAARDRFRGRAIGMIFQTFNLLHGFSAAENVMAALMFSRFPRVEHRARALDLLEQLGIADPLGDPQRMSVGQQQRIAVARAIACEPVLVLADEPTASLDPENAERSMTLIQTTCRDHGAALLCASHDPTMEHRFARVESLDALTHPTSRAAPTLLAKEH
jgi:putative ABC transport system ATP-binding protein